MRTRLGLLFTVLGLTACAGNAETQEPATTSEPTSRPAAEESVQFKATFGEGALTLSIGHPPAWTASQDGDKVMLKGPGGVQVGVQVIAKGDAGTEQLLNERDGLEQWLKALIAEEPFKNQDPKLGKAETLEGDVQVVDLELTQKSEQLLALHSLRRAGEFNVLTFGVGSKAEVEAQRAVIRRIQQGWTVQK